MKANKNLWISIGIIALAGLIFWWSAGTGEDSLTESTGTPDAAAQKSSKPSASKSSAGSSLSYESALEQYKDKRIQLDKNCQAIPNNVTYKNGTSIMIDNRSDVNRTVRFGSSFDLKAYGFKIVKLDSADLPTIWYMDCGTSENVATVLIQK